MFNQGANKNKIKQGALKCLNRHVTDINKFDKTPREFINMIT